MDFKEYVETYKDSVYSIISSYLKIKDPAPHYQIVRDYSDRKGGYRRPGMLLLTGQMFGAKIEDLLLPAAAMQVSEDWILIHDDIEDNSELRRGKPALHKLYGNEIAINAGDALHLVMWGIIKDYMVKVGLKKGGAIFDKFYNLLEYTVEGQYVETDFIYNVHDLSKISEQLYYRIVNSKTCYYTLYGPMQLGAMIAGKKGKTLDMLKEIGEPAGIAFQITDDILDMTADEATFGKKRYGDLYEGKATLIIFHAYKNATDNEKIEINRIYAKRRENKNPEEIKFLIDIIEKYKSIDYAKGLAEEYGMKATKTIEKYKKKLPDNEYRSIMLSAIEEMYRRKH